MSLTITVVAPNPLPVRDLLDATGLDDVQCKEELGAHWPTEPRHLYRPRRSVRTIEVTHAEGEFDVRILSASNRADHELARALVLAAARLTGGEIRSEHGGTYDADGFAKTYDDDWIEGSVSDGPRVIRALIDSGRGPLTVGGVIRPFVVGDWTLSQLDDDDLADSFQRYFHALQWMEPQLEDSGTFITSGENRTSLAFWLSDRAVVLPNVDIIVLRDGDEMVNILAESIPELCPDARRLDDAQWAVPAIPASEWPAFMGRAAPFSVSIP